MPSSEVAEVKKGDMKSTRDRLSASDVLPNLQDVWPSVHGGRGGGHSAAILEMSKHTANLQTEVMLLICAKKTSLPSQIIILPKTDCWFWPQWNLPCAHRVTLLSSQRACALKRLPGLCCWDTGLKTHNTHYLLADQMPNRTFYCHFSRVFAPRFHFCLSVTLGVVKLTFHSCHLK